MRYVECRIVLVFPDRLCLDAIGINGYDFFEDISYSNSGMKQSGDLSHPESGDVILVELVDDNQAKLHKFYTQRSKDSSNMTNFHAGQGGPLNLKDQLPGDRTLTGPDGAWLYLLRGSLASMGTTPLCQTVYLGLENLIRTVCSQYEAIGSGFRVYSVNTDEGIVTRLCFSGSDQLVSKGIADNPLSLSENFEYEIDITSKGMTWFIGNIDPTTGKRINNFVLTINPSGEVHFLVGQNIQGALYPTGACTFKILDDNHNILYNKSIATNTLDGKGAKNVLVKEVVVGDIVRQVTGNVFDQITGIHESNSHIRIATSVIQDISTTISKHSASVNLDNIETTPKSGIALS